MVLSKSHRPENKPYRASQIEEQLPTKQPASFRNTSTGHTTDQRTADVESSDKGKLSKGLSTPWIGLQYAEFYGQQNGQITALEVQQHLDYFPTSKKKKKEGGGPQQLSLLKKRK